VNAADYVVWRKTDNSPQGYADWRQNFGDSQGAGSGGSVESNGAVPEPTALMLGLVAVVTCAFAIRSRS
jgi:hypothetical protein